MTSPSLAYQTNLIYRNGVFVILYANLGRITTSIDFGNTWETTNPFYIPFPSNKIDYGPYIFGDRWFVNIGSQLYFRTERDTTWKKSHGLSKVDLYLPSWDEAGILYATYFPIDASWPISPDGHTSLYFSLDSGANWQKLADSVTNSTDVFIGSDYIFLASQSELWRMPKSALPTLKVQEQKNTSLTLSCFPNPAATSTHISYSIPQHSDVLIEAFDVMGRSVARIMSGAKDAGAYEAVWDTNLLPAGSYIIRLTADGESVSKVVEVVK
jgi:hypothetical protein